MSEKITFGELVESIAEKTDNSKKFTHDFLKDFVSVINSGLEEDGKVNIAGFGKFELNQVDEREGYNPQTEEKMTIPAHNKVNFKPYKGFRELVNTAYSHLEPELLEEEQGEPQPDPSQPIEDQNVGTEETTEQSYRELYDPVDTEQKFFPDSPAPIAGSEDVGTEQENAEKPEETTSPPESSSKVGSKKWAPVTTQTPNDSTEPAAETKEEQTDMASLEPRTETETGRQSAQTKNTRVWATAAAIGLLIIAFGAWLIISQGPQESRQTEPLISGSPQQTESTESAPESVTGSESQNAQSQTATEPDQQAQTNQQSIPSSVELEEGQTLWSLAQVTYGDPYLWPWIYRTNKNAIDNPNLIYAGSDLSLPNPELPGNRPSSQDSLEVAIGYVDTYRWYKQHEQNNGRYYLWAAKKYDQQVIDHIDRPIDKDDLAFVNRVR